MDIAIQTIFALELALLFTHEMDALRRQEWNMFILLKDMPDENAYRLFLLFHVPLYTLILFLLFSPYARVGQSLIDVFLVFHMLLHIMFRNHKANKFHDIISKGIIYVAGFLAVVHLIAIYFSSSLPLNK